VLLIERSDLLQIAPSEQTTDEDPGGGQSDQPR
jgi:hypothetical protein